MGASSRKILTLCLTCYVTDAHELETANVIQFVKETEREREGKLEGLLLNAFLNAEDANKRI